VDHGDDQNVVTLDFVDHPLLESVYQILAYFTTRDTVFGERVESD